MDLYSYHIKLIDPLFFAREGISGAFTPPYLHATALNHALTWAMGRSRDDQSYFMADKNRNNPYYKSSLIDNEFYLTPARLVSSLSYYTEIVKGDGDKAIQVGYGNAKIDGISVGKNEVLKAYRIYSISIESIFEGYLYTKLNLSQFPKLIRLGSFRGLALFEINGPLRVIGREKEKYCDHPVDPLVSKVLKGIPVPMLPYPIVDQAMVKEVWEIRKFGQRIFVACSPYKETVMVEPVKNIASVIF